MRMEGATNGRMYLYFTGVLYKHWVLYYTHKVWTMINKYPVSKVTTSAVVLWSYTSTCIIIPHTAYYFARNCSSQIIAHTLFSLWIISRHISCSHVWGCWFLCIVAEFVVRTSTRELIFFLKWIMGEWASHPYTYMCMWGAELTTAYRVYDYSSFMFVETKVPDDQSRLVLRTGTMFTSSLFSAWCWIVTWSHLLLEVNVSPRWDQQMETDKQANRQKKNEWWGGQTMVTGICSRRRRVKYCFMILEPRMYMYWHSIHVPTCTCTYMYMYTCFKVHVTWMNVCPLFSVKWITSLLHYYNVTMM